MKPKIWSDLKGYIYKPAGTSMLFKACIYESRITDMDTAEPSWTI